MLNVTVDQAGTVEYIATLNVYLDGRNLNAYEDNYYRAERKAALASLPAALRAAALMNDGWLAAHEWLGNQNITG